MTIFLFIVILVALIVVHELGHFFAAKLSKMRVDEFGVGYPPRAWGIRRGETEYTLNWLPFGGFVKIYGEDGTDMPRGDKSRAFSARPKWQQALVLVAGIAMNLVFAWLLFSVVLAVGTPRALSPEEAAVAPDAALTVAGVLPGSPADEAGIMAGDTILSASQGEARFESYAPEAFTEFVGDASQDQPVMLSVKSLSQEVDEVQVVPETGVIPGNEAQAAIGVSLITVGTISVPWWQAPYEGLLLTIEVTKQTAVGLAHFFASIFTFTADLAQVSGPVGIAGAVGNASEGGIAPLLALTAVISVNLALINLIPIPALDGGRLLFVLVEAVTRRPIKASVAGAVNAVGFMLLILLMVVVTVNDIFKIAG